MFFVGRDRPEPEPQPVVVQEVHAEKPAKSEDVTDAGLQRSRERSPEEGILHVSWLISFHGVFRMRSTS